MTDKQFKIIRSEIAFWALLVLAAVWTQWWASTFATVVALIVWAAMKLEEREPGEGFWAKVWRR